MKSKQKGYTLAGALAMIGVMSVLMALSVPVWTRVKQRDNEEELIFRGREYVEAIARYHQKFNSFPPDLETLYKQKFLRKQYADPMTESGKWKVLRPDSLVETGEAGQINQPGSKKNLNEQRKKDLSTTRDKRPDEESDEPKDPLEQDEQNPDQEEEADEEETETVGPVAGVVSRSKKKSIKVYNGQDRYNKWVFVFAPQQTQQQQDDQQQGDEDSEKSGGKNKPKKPGKNQPKQPNNPPNPNTPNLPGSNPPLPGDSDDDD